MIPTLFGVQAATPQVAASAVASLKFFETVPKEPIVDGSPLKDFFLLGRTLKRLRDGRAQAIGGKILQDLQWATIFMAVGNVHNMIVARSHLANAITGVKLKDWKLALKTLDHVRQLPSTFEFPPLPFVHCFITEPVSPAEMSPDETATAAWPPHENIFWVPEDREWKRVPSGETVVQIGEEHAKKAVRILDGIHQLPVSFLLEETKKLDDQPVIDAPQGPERSWNRIKSIAISSIAKQFYKFILTSYSLDETDKDTIKDQSYWIVVWLQAKERSHPELFVWIPKGGDSGSEPTFTPYKTFVQWLLAEKKPDPTAKGVYLFRPVRTLFPQR